MGDLLTVGSVQKELKEAQHLVESFLQSRLNVEVEQKSFNEFQDALKICRRYQPGNLALVHVLCSF